MKAKIKKFGFEIKEGFTSTIQIDKKLKTMKDQYRIVMGQVHEEGQLFEVEQGDVLEFDAFLLRRESLYNSMIMKIKIRPNVIAFLTETIAKGIEEVGIELK